MLDEKKLIHACIKGERAAQKQLYEKYAGKLYAVSLRYMKSSDDANDVLQDSFIKIFGRLETFRFDCPFELWLKRIVINTSLTALGKRKVNYDIDDYQHEVVEISGNLGLENLGYNELMKMIHSLPEGCRMVFNLFAVEGYKHSEIAEMLKISEGTSKSQYSRARSILMEKIELENSKLEDR
jgi:RNA polymerase sigma factor (sigma-70 family)